MTRTRTADAGFRRRPSQTALVASVLVVTALAMAACSSGSDSKLQTAPTKQKSSTTSGTANPKLPISTASIQQKVLTAWLDAEQQIYAYADEPPAPLRADLVAGQTTTDLFPKLGDYYVDPALQSEGTFLLELKMQLLNGPTSYNFGKPSVTALSTTSATVAFCTTDSGTTTAAGLPGPLTLDGGAGGSRGTSTLEFVSGSWRIASGQSTGVTRC
jgi:hypothetical protein